ncbi:LAMI_0H10704g1_1 [Lachancea mirantina]|uniref:Cytochrome c oxidase assembly factor 3 n=1 Tax=Lachancea mirantina TaxID=1230905 RepID=A0A1G4KGW1_9SACH|nr:LAMI_0H10704g1_1 [Lachancea mirantina]
MVFEPSPYQDRRTWKMTPAMLRARRPFLKKNVAGLLVLLGVTGGIYAYTYRFLQKDNDFVDVPIPPIDEKELAQLRREYEEQKQRRA